ncbi:MAG: UDP-2,3-diacylglucosamine diphosphatase [Bacteroidales bacterium]|nr:UDP-2,3-diacylglucosamine diphosphatase [Bacteroidales bacterium]
MILPQGKKVFFVSDLHLGAPSCEASREREKKFVSWVEEHRHEMGALFLLGDIFDYWFEYRYVVQKGFVRLFGSLASLCDEGIPVYFFGGNHDSWTKNYFQKEIGIKVFKGNAEVTIENGVETTAGSKTFFIGHGDGLDSKDCGSQDYGYKIIKWLFGAGLNKMFFAFLHPWTGYLLATGFSRSSRKANAHKPSESRGEAGQRAFIKEILKNRHFDYFIFAHTHHPILENIKSSKYLNTGDWLTHYSYGVYDGKDLSLKFAIFVG